MRHQVDLVNQLPFAPDTDVLEAIHAVMHRARARQHEAMRAVDPDLTPLEGKVLGYFARHPGSTLRQLAEHAGRDKGQLARLVQGLRERGLLDAQPDPTDGRATLLTLSAAAAQRHQAVQRQRRRLAERAAAGLGPDERATLVALLGRVAANLESLS